jgi:hypothetical protein
VWRADAIAKVLLGALRWSRFWPPPCRPRARRARVYTTTTANEAEPVTAGLPLVVRGAEPMRSRFLAAAGQLRVAGTMLLQPGRLGPARVAAMARS